ncbi:MAG: peptide chain release factor 2 [Bacteroidales bacterium]
MINNEHVKDIDKRLDALRGFFDIDGKKNQVNDLQKLTESPDFWNDPKKAEQTLRKISSINKWIDAFDEASQKAADLKVLFDFYQEGEGSEEEVTNQYDETVALLEDLELKKMLNKEEDHLNAIITINAGAGGTESQDWAEMLMRMYLRWGERNHYKTKVLDRQEGETAGIKSTSIEFEGENAYGYLKGESGVHRLVRLSPFDANNKRHTSFASVYAYPVVDDNIEIEINPADLSWDTFRSSGPGGQNVNKIESAVRVRHAPSGLVVECQETRSQGQNREKALTMLKSQLYEIELRKKREKIDDIEGSKKKIEWGSQIRNYVFHPYKMVKDLRTNLETSNVQNVMDGEIDAFIKAYLIEFA